MMNTSSGNHNGIGSGFTSLSGHNANLPASTTTFQSGSIGIHNNQLGTSFILGNGNIVRYATDVLTTT